MKIMKKFKIILIALVFMAFGVSSASAAEIALFDLSFNLNGTEYYLGGAYIPVPGLDDSLFDYSTGLGTLEFTYNPGSAGDYYLLAFFDHEIDFDINSYDNETGASNGTPAAGQSWEIDEPGYADGDILNNFLGGDLDNKYGYYYYPPEPPDPESEGYTIFPNDVSMAMGWNFNLAADEYYAIITFLVSETDTGSGFYLSHTDPDSVETFYLSSDLTVVPEPATMILLGSGLICLAGFRRKFRKA